jgi:hypothetical protein
VEADEGNGRRGDVEGSARDVRGGRAGAGVREGQGGRAWALSAGRARAGPPARDNG